jgi:hypothetical protein
MIISYCEYSVNIGMNKYISSVSDNEYTEGIQFSELSERKSNQKIM